VGGWHACALLNNSQHSVQCWGDNSYGQLGDGTTIERTAPVDVVITEADGTRKLLTGVKAISAGVVHSCAILSDSSVACWGSNYYGQLGDGNRTASQTSPVAVVISESDGTKVKLTGVSEVSAGYRHSCALLWPSMSGACWGDNAYGEFGVPTGLPIYSNSPITLPVVRVSQLSAGSGYTCAALADARTTDCWGTNQDGQIGVGTTTDKYDAPQVVSLVSVKMISSGDGHSCAVMSDTGVKCWGGGFFGELGNGDDTTRRSPVDVLAVSP
jgi:alpha-tubulin suppressor-like RCC1 family protein